jgi:XTP/dITP diphosphohydrolase
VTEFVLATANPDKAREIGEILGDVIKLLPRPAEAGDVAETGDTLEENARLKAQALVEFTGLPVIADDTGLEVVALGGAPGVYSARFAGEGASYGDNVRKLIASLEGAGERTARFRTVAIALWPDGREIVEEGCIRGRIPATPRGANGFGYDPVFEPEGGDGRTFAEMEPLAKHRFSHRGAAFRALAKRLVAELS